MCSQGTDQTPGREPKLQQGATGLVPGELSISVSTRCFSCSARLQFLIPDQKFRTKSASEVDPSLDRKPIHYGPLPCPSALLLCFSFPLRIRSFPKESFAPGSPTNDDRQPSLPAAWPAQPLL